MKKKKKCQDRTGVNVYEKYHIGNRELNRKAEEQNGHCLKTKVSYKDEELFQEASVRDGKCNRMLNNTGVRSRSVFIHITAVIQGNEEIIKPNQTSNFQR